MDPSRTERGTAFHETDSLLKGTNPHRGSMEMMKDLPAKVMPIVMGVFIGWMLYQPPRSRHRSVCSATS